MKKKIPLSMIILVVLGVLIGGLVYVTLTAGYVKVVVATRDVGAMTPLQLSDLTIVDVPENVLATNEYYTKKEDLVGQSLLYPILKNNPVYVSNVSKGLLTQLTNNLNQTIKRYNGDRNWIGMTIPIGGLNAYSAQLSLLDRVILMQAGQAVMEDVPIISIQSGEGGISSISIAVSAQNYSELTQLMSKGPFSLALMGSDYVKNAAPAVSTDPVPDTAKP